MNDSIYINKFQVESHFSKGIWSNNFIKIFILLLSFIPFILININTKLINKVIYL